MTFELESKHLDAGHAGTVVRRLLKDQCLSVTDLAERSGLSRATINNILAGEVLTANAAARISRVLRVDADLLLRIEARHRLAQERQELSIPEAESWARRFPMEWLANIGQVRASWREDPGRHFLDFIQRNSLESVDELAPAALGRVTRHRDRDTDALTAWLIVGERLARTRRIPAYDKKRFREVVNRLPATTIAHRDAGSALKGMVEAAGEAGVAVEVVPAPPNANINGATFWISPDRPVVMISGRNRRAHIAWFTLAHEYMHVLRHSKSDAHINLDLDREPQASAEDDDGEERLLLRGHPDEAEADWLAAQLLVNPNLEERLNAITPSEDTIKALAQEYGVHAEVLVGRLLHEGRLRWNYKWVHRILRPIDPDAVMTALTPSRITEL